MSTGIIVAIVVVVIVIGAVLAGVAVRRRRRLQQRFGPEYDRLAGERDSKRKAETELTARERRVRDLDIQPLSGPARAGYAAQWASIQEQFVDAPADAVCGAQLLVTAVMTERGYPVEHDDQVLADLSVEYSGTLDSYRAAEQISASAAAGTASTEDLRQAMIHYRTLFSGLLGDPADAVPGPAESNGSGQVTAADTTTAEIGDVDAAQTGNGMAAAGPVSARQQFNGSDAGELDEMTSPAENASDYQPVPEG
jgi:hypothetical protein